jgi:AcrR family transcriptional regulator
VHREDHGSDAKPVEAADDAQAVAARREAIADAAVRILARDGIRGLSQRAVDQELGLPPGSTSYYARTDRQLVQLVVRRLAARTAADVGTGPAPSTVDGATQVLVAVLDAIAARRDDVRARLALTVDVVDDAELHSHLTHQAPVRGQMLDGAERLLLGIGVSDARRHAGDLVALLNGLLYDRTAGPGADPDHRARADAVVRAYLTGVTRLATS